MREFMFNVWNKSAHTEFKVCISSEAATAILTASLVHGFHAGVSLSGAGETRRIRTSALSPCNLLLNIFVVLAESRRPALYFLFV